jgi:SnoaL-like domain
MNQPTIETLERLLDAFNAHDLDAVMSFFVDDCVLELPRGPDPWGRRLEGRDRVREGLAGRFAGIPDVHYASTAIGSAEAAGAPNGSSPVRPRRARGSRSAAATCSSSEATRSRGRTPTGRSSRRSLSDRRPLAHGLLTPRPTRTYVAKERSGSCSCWSSNSRRASTHDKRPRQCCFCGIQLRTVGPEFVEFQHSLLALLPFVQGCATNVEGGWM